MSTPCHSSKHNTNRGRIDLTIKINGNIYILEFKVDGPGQALAQIKERNYQQKVEMGSGLHCCVADFRSNNYCYADKIYLVSMDTSEAN
ncbi:MAG TPA: hypothetical protein ENK33_01490 [Desulfobacterales bacterium]|nr:hypothetical protein [Desulfobacterales bacterium]